MRCWCGLREIENVGEASPYLDIRSFGILLNCMNYKYALWSLVEPKRSGGSVFYRVLQKISIRLMRVSIPKQRCPVLLFCVILTV